MKRIMYTVLLAATFMASCSKSYLDKTPYTATALNSAITGESDMLVALTGTYSQLRSYYLFGTANAMKGDIMGDNTYVTTSNSGRYTSMNNFSFTTADSYAYYCWYYNYIAIKYANTVINASVASSTNADQYRGEAYAIRALCLFDLVRNFGHPYTVAPDDPGVPIITTFNQDTLPARSSVRAVYAQVLADLDKAYTLMTTYRGTAYLSKYAAKALQARVYQNMGDWTNAKTAALDVINNSGWVMLASTSYVAATGSLGSVYTASTYSPGGYWSSATVQSSTKNETMFEIASDVTNNNGYESIGSLFLQIGGGYGDILALDGLYNLYSSTDVRRGLVPNAGTYRSGQAGNTYLCYKYPNAFGTSDRDDTKLIRLSDIILIAAEAYYNTPDETNALTYLNKVAKQRDASFAGYTSTGTQVLEDILTERRKELAFEGSRFWDLVRLKRSWTKISNPNPLKTVSVNAANNSNASFSKTAPLVYPIPQTEILANTNMVQNPEYQ
ncbi:MAG: RagB/SusD family nutrient uptake outer membrane protein [Chitinophagaceae bacterium]